MYCQRQEFLTCIDKNNRIYQTPISQPQPCATNTPVYAQNPNQQTNYCQTNCQNYNGYSTANSQQQQQQNACGYVPSSLYPNLQYDANQYVYTVGQSQKQQQQPAQPSHSSQNANPKQARNKKKFFKGKNSKGDTVYPHDEEQSAKKKFSLRAISLKKKLCILFGCLCCIVTIVLLGLIPVFLQLAKKTSSTVTTTTSTPSIITFIITNSPASVNNDGFKRRLL
jgi:hypothetical protein